MRGIGPRACRGEVRGIPPVPRHGPGRAGLAAKRAFDVVAALVLLAVAAIPLAILGLAVRWQFRRPALFRQTRVTGPARLAEIIKLRTLRGHGDPDTVWITPLAQSSTRLGRFLRATHADELPQLINVLRGDMSLVGPRPERPYFAHRFCQEIPGYARRTRMKAGLTGWAQVHGLNGNTSIADRAAFDNAYIDNWSFWLDLVILAQTVGLAVSAMAGRDPAPSAVAGQDPAPSAVAGQEPLASTAVSAPGPAPAARATPALLPASSQGGQQ